MEMDGWKLLSTLCRLGLTALRIWFYLVTYQYLVLLLYSCQGGYVTVLYTDV